MFLHPVSPNNTGAQAVSVHGTSCSSYKEISLRHKKLYLSRVEVEKYRPVIVGDEVLFPVLIHRCRWCPVSLSALLFAFSSVDLGKSLYPYSGLNICCNLRYYFIQCLFNDAVCNPDYMIS
jgi:hypothetical protein